MTGLPETSPTPYALKLGDCVQLVSGGPSMVVEHLRTDDFAGCSWFDKAEEVCRDAFPKAALRLAPNLRVVGGSSAA